MKKMNYVGCLAICMARAFGANEAGEAPVRHPGDTVRISVTFSGEDAKKITNAQSLMRLTTAPREGQSGFIREIFVTQAKQVSSDTWETSYIIPETQASGEYRLTELRSAVSNDLPVMFNYPSDSADFPQRTIRIENPKRLTKPTLKDVKVQ